MLDLSPTKLIIIFVVVIVLLGPKRLPQVARQLGAGWRKIVGFQQQIERELRENMPDLPSSQDIVRFARSPVTMLNQLAQMPASPADALVEDAGAPAPPDGTSATTSDGVPAPADGTIPDSASDGPDSTDSTDSTIPDVRPARPPATGGVAGDGDRWPEDRSSGAAPPGPPPAPARHSGAGRAAPAPRTMADLGALAADDPSMN